jgi:dTDP-glucose 4,6-dehydratase
MSVPRPRRVLQNVLVTGGAGFIGSHFVRDLLAEDPAVRIVTLDALTYAGSRANLHGVPADRHTFVVGDIGDTALGAALLRAHSIDTVVHFAAESHVDRAIAEPAAFLRTNLLGTASLLEAAQRVWLDEERGARDVRFHHVGTDEVYGSLSPTAAPVREGAPYAPSNPYSASKAGADHLVMAAARTYGLPITHHIASNTYGPNQYPEKLIPLFLQNALAGRALPLYGDGRQVRDWLYVSDHVAAIRAILRESPTGESWHVGGGLQVENRDLAQRLCALLDTLRPARAPHAALIRAVADRLGHDRRYALDSAKIAERLGWRPRVGLDEGLRVTLGWYATQMDVERT